MSISSRKFKSRIFVLRNSSAYYTFSMFVMIDPQCEVGGAVVTANQVAYWQLQESKRSNQVKERETERSNRVKEEENERSHKASEYETKRSNLANELLTSSRDAETARKNREQERLTAIQMQNQKERWDNQTTLEAINTGANFVKPFIGLI